MANQLPNRYSVTPLGGLDVGTKLGNIIEGSRQQVKMREWQETAPDIIKGGDPNAIADLMIKYPEMQEKIKQAAGVAAGPAGADKSVELSRSILTGSADPKEALTRYIQEGQAKGEDVSKYLNVLGKELQQPGAAQQWAEKWTALNDPPAFKSYQSATAPAGVDAGTANIQDWNHYRKLQKSDPISAEMFAKQVGIKGAGDPKTTQTNAQKNFDTWAAMPEGGQKSAFAQMVGIDPKKSPKEERAKMEALDTIASEIDGAKGTVALLDQLLTNNDFISSLTGLRGATPFSVPGGVGFDAMVVFDQMKNSLTMDNLGKMKGVLSDADIKMIKSASAGIEPGMSEKEFTKRLNTIKNVIDKKISKQEGRLGEAGYKLPEKTDLPVGLTEDTVTFNMEKYGKTREQVIEKFSGGK